MKTEKEKCRKFETCNAPLCPLDVNPKHIWYTDAEICSRPQTGNFQNPARPEYWIRNQKRIQKLNPDPHEFYTIKMLSKIKKVGAGISGLKTVGYNEKAERVWLKEKMAI